VKVTWFDWSDEAFRKAQSEDKPIILAIGAAWCHGCRVMDEGTYADEGVARLLNTEYVPIRADSDRRPDLNERFNMGGWPTVAFLTPSGDLMGGTTYLDSKQMHRVLAQLKAGYLQNKQKIAEEIAKRDAKIAQVLHRGYAGVPQLTPEVFRKTVRGIVGTFDPVHAGFGRAPKFPMVSSLRVVLQALRETGGPDFREIFTRTLDAMGDRGMYDGVDGGFFHYVTNDVWSAPRFEKLAEDNAALIRLYLDASLVTGQEKYGSKALDALEWVQAKLLDMDRGVFYGSQAGDEEYYVLPEPERKRRAPPLIDRTIFTTASAAMASAFLRAAQVFEVDAFAQIALRGLDWLLRECVRGDEVSHYHDGRPHVTNLARDPIVLGRALLDAFDHTGEARWLEAAETVVAPLTSRFWSDVERGVVDRIPEAADRGDMARPRKGIDDNALTADNLARLWRHRAGDHHRDWAQKILLSFPDFLDEYGHFTAEYAMAANWLMRPSVEITVGDPALAGAALRPFVPGRTVRRDESGKVTVAQDSARREGVTPEEVRQALEEIR
jgi:hypothetical protein